jgi:hypothetical protein
MEKIIINLPYKPQLINRQLVKFFNFAMDLTNQEQVVLAKLIEYNIEYASLEPLKRAKFILSSTIRKEICDSIGIKTAAFNQLLLRLKKKKYFNNYIINADGVLASGLMFTPDKDGLEIKISFKNDISRDVKKEETPVIQKNTEIKIETFEEKSIEEIEPTDYIDPTEGIEIELS